METSEVDRIKYLIGKLKRVTLAVQIAPFVYTGLYILSMILYFILPENAINVIDTLFYVSPVITIIFLIESRMLKLCKWHRRACLLPILPQITVFVDYHIYELSECAMIISIATPILISVLLLIAAYNVFFRK